MITINITFGNIVLPYITKFRFAIITRFLFIKRIEINADVMNVVKTRYRIYVDL